MYLTLFRCVVRASFAGMACKCKLRTQGELQNCISNGHQGILGEVKEFGRKQLRVYHKAHADRWEILVLSERDEWR